MIEGTPREARWIRSEPFGGLPVALLNRILSTSVGDCRVDAVERLPEGFRNANFKVDIENRSPVVLRIYRHDPSLCQKELDLLKLVGDSVPVANVIHAEPAGVDDIPPFLVMDYVDGITFRELKRKANGGAIADAAFSAGQTLAAIGQFKFRRAGWITAGPTVGATLLEGADPGPRFVDLCLASQNVRKRLPKELRDRVSKLVWDHAADLAALDDDPRLVHCDYGQRNLLVRSDGQRWEVAAVLDWEFAVAGSPLADIGHFLRYELESYPLREPHFSTGFLDAGGYLPSDWRYLARLVDLTALCESLTHDDLPDPIALELAELIRATVEHRDPVLAH